MSDLLEELRGTASELDKLSQASHSYQEAATATLGRAIEATDGLQRVQNGLLQRGEDFLGQLAQRQQAIEDEVTRLTRTLSHHDQELESQARAALESHRKSRERLAQLRQSLVHQQEELVALEKECKKEFQTLRDQSRERLSAAQAKVKAASTYLQKTFLVGLMGLKDSVEKDARSLSARFQSEFSQKVRTDVSTHRSALGDLQARVQSLLNTGSEKASTDASGYLVRFQQASETDWRGGRGDVTGSSASRAQAMQTAAQTRSSRVAKQSAQFASAAGEVSTAMVQAEQKYERVKSASSRVQSLIEENI